MKKVTGVYTMEDAKIQLTCNFQYCKIKIHRTIIVLERIKTPIPENQQTISARTMGYARSSNVLTSAVERGLKYGRKTGEIG